MGMFSDLIIRWGWDGREVTKGIAKTELETKKSAEKIEKDLEHFTHHQNRWVMRRVTEGLGLAGGYEFIKRRLEALNKISEGSEKFGLTPDRFQELQYAVEQTGIPMEELVKQAANLPISAQAAVREFRLLGKAIPKDILENVGAAEDSVGAAGQTLTGAGNWLLGKFAKGWLWLIRKEVEASNQGLPPEKRLHFDPFEEQNNRSQSAWVMRKTLQAEAQAREDDKKGYDYQNFPNTVVGPSVSRDYDKSWRRQYDAIEKAYLARGVLQSSSLDALNKMGGFAGGFGDPAKGNAINQVIQLLERIAKAAEENPLI